MDRFDGGEHNLYGGRKSPEKEKEVISVPKEPEDLNLLMDHSVQKVMRKNRELQKPINELIDKNNGLKSENSRLKRKLKMKSDD